MQSLARIHEAGRHESGFAVLGRHRVKLISFLGTASAGKFTLFDTDTAPISGTYGQSGTTVTVTDADHGLATGDMVGICFSAGTGGQAQSGNYEITVVDADTFTVTMLNSDTITGTPACLYVANPASRTGEPKRWVMCKNVAAADTFANDLEIPNSGFLFGIGVYVYMTNLTEVGIFYE
jgi:ribonuclease BN (tRNA processing enzyme)